MLWPSTPLTVVPKPGTFSVTVVVKMGFPGGSAGKESTCNAGDLGSIPGLEDPPEKGTAYPVQSSGLEDSMEQSMGSQRVGHD